MIYSDIMIKKNERGEVILIIQTEKQTHEIRLTLSEAYKLSVELARLARMGK